MNATTRLLKWLQAHPQQLHSVVDIDPAEKLYSLDLTAGNAELSPPIVKDTVQFSRWINQKLAQHNCRYAIGGYMELRTIYDYRNQFSTGVQERRNLHLGIDIWAEADTPVYAPLGGTIHSFHDNNQDGDYGPTIILQHHLGGLTLYSLYGHLSKPDLDGLQVGQSVNSGQLIAHFGTPGENGNWPPHLHFQLMLDMDGLYGDYPGACKPSEKEKYLQVIPDASLLLGFTY